MNITQLVGTLHKMQGLEFEHLFSHYIYFKYNKIDYYQIY
jgi:hypothetical protein